MDILEKFIRWLGWDDKITANALIIAIAIIALIYTIAKWISTSKKLKNINNVAKTAPKNIQEYLDKGQQNLQDSISNASTNICKTISDDRVRFAEKLAAIEKSTDFLTAQRATVTVQQGQLLAEVSSLYALHDRDQALVRTLQEENALLKQEKAQLQRKLDELRPRPVQTLSL